jgi:flavin-dependent dehydrogenase
LIDRAKNARHKVCGEFISPGGRQCLEDLGVWDEFAALGPCRITRCKLNFGHYTNQWNLTECAWGLSRLRLDQLLLDKAASLGVVVRRGEVFDRHRHNPTDAALIVACGRQTTIQGGNRLFGFKAHFDGPSDDAVELFFDACGYVGVSGIENQLTNVCGIARESTLRRYGFDFDEIVRRSPSMAERLGPLRRQMRWIVIGPIVFSSPRHRTSGDQVYVAGDALGFVDPFTGSGILNGMLTGRLAGLAAGRGIPAAAYLRLCRSLLGTPFAVSCILRSLAGHPGLHCFGPYIPGQLLFRWTRARVERAHELCGRLSSQGE